MSCPVCAGFAGRHDPIAHDAEPEEDTVTEPTDELREALAEALERSIDQRRAPLMSRALMAEVATDLLPVVTAWAEQHARERAVEELRAFYIAAANQAARMPRRGPNAVADWLLDFGHAYSILADATRPDPGRC